MEISKRITWIDCAKAVAMIAVVIDHSGDFIYDSYWVRLATYYAVTLFILLSGVSTWLAVQKGKRITLVSQGKKAIKLFIQYACATLITVICFNRFFDLKTYISCLFSFNAQFIYYFLFLYLQILLVSPFLIEWCKICNNQKCSLIFHLFTVIILAVFCAFSIKYTYTLPLEIGGQYLFGGTYLLVYYLGVLLANYKCFEIDQKFLKKLAIVSIILWVVWYYLYGSGKLIIDDYLTWFWGNERRPPKIQMIIYTVITLFVCYSVFSLLEMSKNRIVKGVMQFITYIGRNTINIYLYHMWVRALMTNLFPDIQNVLAKWIVYFIPMLVLPVIMVNVSVKLFHKFMGDCIK